MVNIAAQANYPPFIGRHTKQGSNMIFKHNLVLSAAIFSLLSGCSAYSTEDYEDPAISKKESSCINMEPAQEMKCKEREKSLIIGLGADSNCNHPYEYEKNRCKSEKVKQQKALDESLKKHTDK